MNKVSILGMVLTLACLTWQGSAAAENVGTTAGLLLTMGFSARTESMAGAQMALAADEAAAAGGNPAGLAECQSLAVSAIYYQGAANESLGALAYSQPLNHGMALGASLAYYDAGKFELSTLAGEWTNASAERDGLLTLSCAGSAGALLEKAAWGANVKMFSSTLTEAYQAFTIVLDVGLRAPLSFLDKNLFAGMAIKNVGLPMKYIQSADPLPVGLGAGLGGLLYSDANLFCILGLDGQYDIENKFQAAIGGEITIAKQIFFRAGYKTGQDLGGLTLGMGLKTELFQLDYAFGMMQSLHSLHRLGLTLSLSGQPSSTQSAVAPKAVTETVQAPAQPSEIEKAIAEAAQGIMPSMQSEAASIGERVEVGILEAQKTGGRITMVLLNAGKAQGIREGMRGVIQSPEGEPLAGIEIQETDNNKSLAAVVTLSRGIGKSPVAIIEKPIKK